MDPVHPRDLRISDADRHRVAEHLREAAGEGRLDLEELDERLEATYAARTYADLVPLTEDLPGHRDLTPVDRPRPSPLPPGPPPGGPIGGPPGGQPSSQPASPFPPPSPTLADLLSSFSAGPRHAPPVPWSAPAPARPGPAGPPPGPAPGGTLAIMGDVRRRGPWQVGERHPVLALMGSVTLDLREAVRPAPPGEVTLVVTAVMGSVVVVVDHDTVLDVQGLGVMGTFDERTSRRDRADAGAAVGPAPTGPVVRVRGVALMGSVVVRRKGPRVGPGR